jgi:hypothetical protein
MAAGVAQPGQGIVLGEESDGRPAIAVTSAESRLQITDTALDIETVFNEKINQPSGGTALLESHLGVVVQSLAQSGQLRITGIDISDNGGF